MTNQYHADAASSAVVDNKTTNKTPAGEARLYDARLLRRYIETRDVRVRDELVHRHQALVRYFVIKFSGRGEPVEDLMQVGNIGLLKAIERYNPDEGVAFTTYAGPNIIGEVQRYFRDKCWRMKVPRSIMDRCRTMLQTKEALTQQLDRCPSVKELAEACGITEEAALEAMEVSDAYRPLSLDGALGKEDDLTRDTFLGQDDDRLRAIVEHNDLYTAIDRLDKREKTIVRFYYEDELSQMEIASRMGISQMHVSRLHKRALSTMAEYMSSVA